MTNFTWKTREEYLVWRLIWKEEYKARSIKIRTLKKEIKETQRARQYAGSDQTEREYMRTLQRNALEELAEAKIEAGKQRALRLNFEQKEEELHGS